MGGGGDAGRAFSGRERSAKRMQSGNPPPLHTHTPSSWSQGPIPRSRTLLLGGRGIALKYLLPGRRMEDGVGEGGRGPVKGPKVKPNWANSRDSLGPRERETAARSRLEASPPPIARGERQRPFAGPYVPIILSKGPGMRPRKPIIAFLTKCHRGRAVSE